MPYHAPDEHRALVLGAAERAGARAVHEVIGTTVGGRPIDAVHIAAAGREPDPARPRAMVLGGVHGNEVIGTELSLALLEALCAEPPVGLAAELLSHGDVVVVPVLNVDGRARSMASLGARGRAAWRAPRRNDHRIDLNRNWPPVRGARPSRLPISGTGVRWLPWYRGPRPASEPEVAALLALAERTRPSALVNLHSAGEIITHPWSAKPDPPVDQPGFDQMIDALRAHQRRRPYRSKQSNAWYPIHGASNDWFHDALGTMALTIEISRPAEAVRAEPRRARWAFWWANPADPDEHVSDLVDPCLAALRAGLAWRASHPAAAADR